MDKVARHLANFPGGLRRVQRKVSIPREEKRRDDACGGAPCPPGISPGFRSGAVNIFIDNLAGKYSSSYIERKLRHREIQSLKRSPTDHEQLIRVTSGLSAARSLSSPPLQGPIRCLWFPRPTHWFRSFLLRGPQLRGRDSGLGKERKWRINLFLS